MKWGMWGAHVMLTAIVFGTALGLDSAWSGWRRWLVWASLFLVAAWWEYIAVMSWEYWSRIEIEEREAERRRQSDGSSSN